MPLNKICADDWAAGGLRQITCERVDFDTAWEMLRQSLLNFEFGSPEQIAAWQAGLRRLPEPLQTALPSLAHLYALAEKAWPGRRD